MQAARVCTSCALAVPAAAVTRRGRPSCRPAVGAMTARVAVAPSPLAVRARAAGVSSAVHRVGTVAVEAALPVHAGRGAGEGRGVAGAGGPSEGALTGGVGSLALGLAVAGVVAMGGVEAIGIHEEPANALSIPTWAIHISSLVEWLVGMGLVWKYADASSTPEFKGLTWGMLPLHASGICACTYHLFYNAESLEVLVALQAFLTCVGNCTLWWAAYRIYLAAEAEREAEEAPTTPTGS